jgi:2-dehydropantoate 2-reductase
LANHVPPDQLCIGIAAAFGAIMRGPGHAYHNGMNAIRIGPFANVPMEQVKATAKVWNAAGFKIEAVRDVVAMQWEKLICNVAYSAPCALTGMTVGEMMNDPDMGPISCAAAVEAWTVARALGIPITVEDPVACASLQREYLAHGRRCFKISSTVAARSISSMAPFHPPQRR